MRRPSFIPASLPSAAALALLASLAGSVLIGCFDFLASSEVGNPPAKGAVAGAMLEEGDAPASGALVRLYPVDADPVRDSARLASLPYLDTADAEGTFSLEGVDTGLYNIQAVHPAHGTSLLLRGVRVLRNKTVIARGGVLRPMGAVTFTLPDLRFSAATYVFIAGTGVFARIPATSAESPRITLTGVPPGALPDILYRESPGAEDSLLLQGVEVSPGDTVPAQVHDGWAHSRRIFFNTTATGAGVDADAEHFPVAVRLARPGSAAAAGGDALPFDFSQAAADGSDIRFTDPTGGPHKFEIESWDSANGSALVWVCAGTVRGRDSTQFMRFYWGRPGSASLSQPAFTADLGYTGIWHMQSSPNNRIADAGPGDNPLALSGAAPDFKAALLGTGAGLDGKARQLNAVKALALPQTFTLSLWFRTTATQGGKLIGFGAQPGLVDTSRDRHVWMDDTGQVHFGIYPNQGPNTPRRVLLDAPGRWNDGRWHHMAATLSPAGAVLYMDGRKVDEDTTARSAQVYASNTGYWRVGYDFDLYDWPFKPTSLYWSGDLDEVRVCHKAMSASRIRLEYESQREGARFLRFEDGGP
jgi:hypothetical protein